METNYLKEAFQRLNLVEDDFNLSQDRDVVDELKSFVADDIDAVDEEPIIDVEAESEDDLKDSYIGKVILECDCCHTRIYKDLTDILIDDESGLANIEERCPVCNTESGYNVIGKIEEFKEEDVPVDADDEKDEVDADVEDDIDLEASENVEEKEDEEDEFEESFKEAFNDVITEGDHHGHCNCPDDIECHDDEDEHEHHHEHEEELHEEMGEDDICPECGCNPCKCEKEVKESCNEGCEKNEEKEEVDESLVTEGNHVMDNLRNKMMAMADKEHVEESVEQKEADDLTEGVQIDMNNHIINSDSNDITVDVNNGEVKIGNDFAPEAEGGIEAGDEMIAPLNDEEISEIEANEPEVSPEDEIDDFDALEGDLGDDLGAEDELAAEGEPNDDLEAAAADEFAGEEEIPEDELDIDEFDEESFDEMGESYLRKVYENVDSFLTESVKMDKGVLTVEGLITFNSGNKKHTTFVFENAQRTKRGKVVLEGMNKTFSNSAKAFNLKGDLTDKKFVSESMIYNYSVKTLNESNESETARVYGRVVKR